ncbi:Unknown protein sequence [Pseudomonas syringae pv. maculicola]|nr:Unknown protein sequence [Pseudomonas syringae pv. maculicola]KPB90957.1 Unknown protein sequence [Pseudomonas syringae pv. maculicola str. M6]KPC08114.1 Unknown protein sequence [Pseudomonas amygdali pv. lachrymans]KPC16827.1 Unknown protein sequence [Pseudomonas syringae pv. maculicola]
MLIWQQPVDLLLAGQQWVALPVFRRFSGSFLCLPASFFHYDCNRIVF